jgi:enoyl-CoA hydratase/carnithine racemase
LQLPRFVFLWSKYSMNEDLLIKREERVLIVTMNRPEKRNALDFQLCSHLVSAIEDANSDHKIGVILLRGAGKVFCAGMDLGEVLSPEASGLSTIHEKLFTLGAHIDKPIVAAVQGSAHGGGFGLVANAHVVVAADNAIFGLSEIRLGLWPYLIYRSVTLAMGERRALELSLTGRNINASEALTYGLIHRLVPLKELHLRASEIANEISLSSAEAIHDGMDFVKRLQGLDWQAGGALARQSRSHSFQSADFAEGVRAFLEKRPPRWPSLQAK